MGFNPPYSQNVKTNIGKLFLKLVRKRFPQNSKYHKIFNLNTSRLSYCCTTNVGKETSSNNRTLKCWTKQMTTSNANVIADQNQTAHWMVSHSIYSIQTYIYNIQQQLCLLWNFWRGVQITVQQPYKIFQTAWMHERDWAIKTCVELNRPWSW